ncbi:hypothetical protein ATERTT37_005629 [Aspergillus terreus]
MSSSKKPALFKVAEPGGYPQGAFDPKTFISISWQQNYRHQAIDWEKGNYEMCFAHSTKIWV